MKLSAITALSILLAITSTQASATASEVVNEEVQLTRTEEASVYGRIVNGQVIFDEVDVSPIGIRVKFTERDNKELPVCRIPEMEYEEFYVLDDVALLMELRDGPLYARVTGRIQVKAHGFECFEPTEIFIGGEYY